MNRCFCGIFSVVFLLGGWNITGQEKPVFLESRLALTSSERPFSDSFDGEFGIFVFSDLRSMASHSELLDSGDPDVITGFIEVEIDESIDDDERLTASSRLGVRTSRFTLDPVQAGVAAILDFEYNLDHDSSSGASLELTFEATGLNRIIRVARADDDDAGVRAIRYDSGDPPIQLQLKLLASSRDSSVVRGRGRINYTLRIQEPRTHWDGSSFGVLTSGQGWFERAVPHRTQPLAFNSISPVTTSVTLGTPRFTSRGIIVDGSTVNLDLEGGLLEFGGDGLSPKDHSIALGEGRFGFSTLNLSNGTVGASKDVILAGFRGQPARMTLNAARIQAQETATIPNVDVGKLGNAVLEMSAGSSIDCGSMVIADQSGVVGQVTVVGEGSNIKSGVLTVGRTGVGTLTAGPGTLINTGALTIATEVGSQGTFTLGPQATLTLGLGTSAVGAGGRGTLEVLAGSKVLGSTGITAVGSGNLGLSSVLRLSGIGTEITDLGILVRGGGLFHLRDGASWVREGEAVNELELDGGEALIEGATASLANLRVTPGQLRILSGSELEVLGRIDLATSSRIQVNGTGAKLSGFSRMVLNGILNVSNGGEVFAATEEQNSGFPGEIVVGEGGRIEGSQGVIHSSVFTAQGAVVEPGNSPGILTIDGDLVLGEGSRLRLEVAGGEAISLYDRLLVTGNLVFEGGVIELVFLDEFAPAEGQLFDFVEVDGSVTGTADVQVIGLEDGWDFAPSFEQGPKGFYVTSLSAGVPLLSEREVSGGLSVVDFEVYSDGLGPLKASGEVRGGASWGNVVLQVTGDLADELAWRYLTTLELDAAGSARFLGLELPIEDAVFLRVVVGQ